MKTHIRLLVITVILAVIVGIPLYCLSQKNTNELIKESKDYLSKGDKTSAVNTLDSAFNAASAAKDIGALMDIGDLYIKIDPTLKEKALRAWTEAGHLKCDQ